MKFSAKQESNISSEHLVTLKDGQSVTGVFVGEPHEFYSHWGTQYSSICPGRATCDLCKSGDKGSFRFRLNMAVKENGAFAMKIFEGGAKVFNQLRAINEERALESLVLKISRYGSTKNDTNYVVMPSLQPIAADTLKRIGEMSLHNLDPNAAPAADSKPAASLKKEDVDALPF